MASYGQCFVLVLLIFQTCAVYGNEIIKGSLTFVIDDTGSMADEIRQVKEEVNIIFEKVLSSNASQIENFVLVTFNDPSAQLRTITKDRTEFKRQVAAINVHGGGDCPEYAMTGIELALKESLPLSYLYVFTDASAKDYGRFDQIKSISQKKQSQVVFILTGVCGWREDAGYQVYHKVAKATNGQVFNMMKDDVKDILKYVEETITGRGIPLVVDTFAPGYNNTITYPVDTHTGDVLISVTGKDPKIGEVRGPNGTKPITEPVVDKPEIAIVKVKNATVGDHEVEVGSRSETHVMVTAKSDVNFQLGFSVYRPNSMKDTVTRPAPRGNAFLSVRLLGSGVNLTTAKILDMDGNVITELPLELIDEKTQFYSTSSFNPPFTTFRVAVSGIDVATNSPIERKSPTPVERQSDVSEPKENRAPQITIEGAPTITTEYDAPLRLTCNVHGYPEPAITWEEKDTGITIPTKVEIREVPYDYVSILNIDKANKNVTYQCKASNMVGVNIKYVQVQTKRKVYFDVKETPKDIIVEYNKEGSIVCKVDAYPPASITWYKDGAELSEDSNIDVSSDKSVLTIKYMQVDLQGRYTCEARNDFDRKVYIAKVTISGVEKPVIDKSKEEIRVLEENKAALSCRLLKGIPKPNIRWSYQPADEQTFREMAETSETIYLNNVGRDRAGLYKCTAQNVLGSDSFTTNLVVEYPPTIKEDVKVITSKDDDEVRISCDATGEPAPAVRWFFNNTIFDSTAKSRISTDQSLRFKARLVDTGYYRCEAVNKLGGAKKTTFLNVFVPVTIETPKESTIEVMVGKSKILNCRADGYPKPTIKWTFQGSDPMVPAVDVTPGPGGASLPLRNMQLAQQGLYTCEAENGIGGSAKIVYDVKIYAPPHIDNVYSTKAFEALAGDPTLRIQCKATGSPKPSIVWIKNGLNLALGSDWYDMEDDGTLVIKNIDRDSEGTYVCLAQNVLGYDTEAYEVIVRDSLLPETPTSTVFVQEGKTITINCSLPHESTDQIRWYKGGVVIGVGAALPLYSVSRSDDGLYTCRVSSGAKPRATTTQLVVGFKPSFISDEELTVDFVHGADTQFLSCEAYGEPRPKSAIWKHNGKVLDSTSMSYALGMEYGATGTYECEVSNDFGSIHRTFTVTSRDCILDIKKDFPEKQPIMYSPSLGWPVFDVKDGYMIISHQDYFYFNCPSQFSNPNLPLTSNLMAFCEQDNIIKIYGKKYKFADIQCKEEVKPQVSRTGIPCLPGNTETVKIGYRIFTEFLGVYDVCLDKENNVPLFTKHRISPDHTDRSTEAEWGNSVLPQDFDMLYDCPRQVYDVSSALGRGLSTRDSCCFSKRQLVSSHDLLPGVPTSAAYDYLNIVPHWSTCNSKNWEDVEQSVRNLVKAAGRDLVITTGAARPRRAAPSTDITLQDGHGSNQTVAPYLWKVVQDPAQQASLAIIQVNIPELSEEQALDHVLCPDICGSSISWLEPSNYHNVDDGYTYCCSITEFEKAFGYHNRFSPYMNYVLFDGNRMPDFYMSKK
ncbi:hypothetical protein PYW08_006432 [Mythimna loreyi]|uniref:Uncharacterized protein n=1 Tax=Mythimna loreyi TaxID=667449 RepID=A0ACC2QQ48_9NEOP|nr:hypothetical protein PYW08_006432 [Mythimna loreyi]